MNTSKDSLFAEFAGIAFAGIAAVALFAVTPSLAQHPGATVHGHVNNPAGQDITTGDVKFTQDETVNYKDAKFSNDAPIDSSGNYTATGVKPGDYYVYIVQGDKILDREQLKVSATDTNLTLDDDMSRPAYIKSMTPEQQKQLAAYKKENAAVTSANEVIKHLNTTLKTVRADLAAAAPTHGDVSKDIASMKEAITAKPDVGLLWLTYGDTQLAQGHHLAVADKQAGKAAADDPAVTQMYSGAVDAYNKALTLDTAGAQNTKDAKAAKLSAAGLGADYNQLGNALTAEGKTDDAITAFNNAAKADPTKAGMYFNNAAVVMYNGGQMDGALSEANKAIAADPKATTAYFIKGQALVTKATIDSKTNKLTAPPGCVDAYQKFLQLAPDSPYVPQVKAVLASLGQSIDTSYRSNKH